MKFVICHESRRRIRIKTPVLNMTGEQADRLTFYLRSFPDISDVSVDERTGNATVFFTDENVRKEELLRGLLSGYDENSEEVVKLLPEDTGRELNRKYEEKLLTDIGTHYLLKLFLPAPLAALRTVLKSLPFLLRGVRSLGEGALKVEALDAVAIGVSILRRDFSTAGSVMFLLNTGETMEEWTRKKSVGDLARAMSLGVDRVWVKKDGEEVLVPVGDVKKGDLFIVRRSEIIPLDGTVISGEMTVNQSAMTGESEPVGKCAGGYVYAGIVVEEGECLVRVTQEAGSGNYDRIVRMIEDSEKLKSTTEARAYRLADSLVPYSFLGFAATFILTRNVTKALSFLMVDYSCAMKLSMPLAVLSAIKEAREYGISVKGGKFMELVSEADTVVFDKTGTLTYAAPKLKEVVPFGDNDPDEMLRIAACLEEHYPHSVANAIVNGATERGLKHDELHSKVEYIVAHGVSSYIGEKKAVIGSRHFVAEDEHCVLPEGGLERLEAIPEEYSKIFLAIDGQVAAALCISDPVRAEAGEIIRRLHGLGIRHICMMTGDNRKTAEAVAEQLGLDEFRAEVLPEDKALYVKEKRAEGHKVMMIGDGVNDSPALSEADVGIAIESGAAIAREIADITLSAESLEALLVLRSLSTSLVGRISRNYRFIVGFNSMLIVLGLTGLVTPSLSVLLHNGSTILTGLKSTTKLLEER